ncbi:GAF and ANTAR domain-containing protein [Amycolatopsis alkalitolerans]|uniref:GAF and ANTAR domain-containing protein n=1 Tax=Amycolatopsis alkalitolerans TaxID=2547244 RepID=A0A5C4LXS7_9PSEU|nr:GAF and ANTAR domain-containing protein [Amycolatopsis alkalitolerans]TNC21827.1 GAF and ANTAR domain-containing protein [Amycolatopsis alkalitolerans]
MTDLRPLAELTHTLVGEFDLLEFFQRLVAHAHESVGVAAAGLLLAGNGGTLTHVAASDEQARLLEVYQLQADEGPCLDCWRTGEPVRAPDLSLAADRWPRFAEEAARRGFAAAHALPVRLGGQLIGGLNLFSAKPDELAEDRFTLAQALADVAAIGLLQQRALRRRELIDEQLRSTINARLAVEQAKGVLAAAREIGVEDAAVLLRGYAARHDLQLGDLAARIVRRDPSLGDLAAQSSDVD